MLGLATRQEILYISTFP